MSFNNPTSNSTAKVISAYPTSNANQKIETLKLNTLGGNNQMNMSNSSKTTPRL